jgi:hypothetical protein
MISAAKNLQNVDGNLRPIPISDRCVANSGTLIPHASGRCQSRIQHQTTASGMKNPRFYYANWHNAGNVNTDSIASMGVLTATSAIEYPIGTETQIKFGGSATGVAQPGDTLESDEVIITIPPNTIWYTRPSGISTGDIPTGVITNAANSEGQELGGTDKSMSGTITTASVATFGEMCVTGYPVDRNMRSVVILLDSLAEGIGDSPLNPDLGWAARSFDGLAGFINLGISGASYTNWVNGTDPIYRLPLIAKIRPTHAYCSPPGNDFFAGLLTLAQIKALVVSVGNQLVQMGIKPILWTLPPHTTSSNSFIDLAGQTINPSNYPGGASAFLTDRNSYNSWALAVPAPFIGVIDPNQQCENTPNTDGLWVANGTPFYATASPGGSHPSAAMHALIAAANPISSTLNTYV